MKSWWGRAVALTCLVVCAVSGEARAQGLAEPAMTVLPLGCVTPGGELAAHLRRQAVGLTGHAEELYDDIGRSDWLTGANVGKEFAWERGPYYAKGLVSLALVLRDDALTARAKRWVDAILSSQRADGDFGPKARNWWANMIALWLLRDWCEATGDARVVPFLERYFAFQREAFRTYPLAAESKWAVARAGDELDVVLWLYRRTRKADWLDFARDLSAQSADWTTYYRRGGDPAGPNANGCRSHIVNFMQGLKTPALQSLLSGEARARDAYAAAFAPDGWAMRLYGRPDRMVNGSEPLSDRSASGGTELCAIAERILSCQTVLAATGELVAADDLEIVAYNSLAATLAKDGRGLRYYCLLNQPACEDKPLLFANNGAGSGPGRNGAICPGPHAGFGCCRSNFHFAWPKFVQSLWMRRGEGLAAVAYGPCRVTTSVGGRTVTLAMMTGYPYDGRVEIHVLAGGGRFPIYARVPGWSGLPDAGRFRVFERDWKPGERIVLDFPTPTRLSFWDQDAVAVMRGPLLFALQIPAEETVVPRYQVPFENRMIASDAAFPRKEIRPKAGWGYALLLERDRTLAGAAVEGRGENLLIRARAVKTDFGGWGHLRDVTTGRAVDPPPSPVPEEGGCAETVSLVPVGLTEIRVALFPWLYARD